MFTNDTMDVVHTWVNSFLKAIIWTLTKLTRKRMIHDVMGISLKSSQSNFFPYILALTTNVYILTQI